MLRLWGHCRRLQINFNHQHFTLAIYVTLFSTGMWEFMWNWNLTLIILSLVLWIILSHFHSLFSNFVNFFLLKLYGSTTLSSFVTVGARCFQTEYSASSLLGNELHTPVWWWKTCDGWPACMGHMFETHDSKCVISSNTTFWPRKKAFLIKCTKYIEIFVHPFRFKK